MLDLLHIYLPLLDARTRSGFGVSAKFLSMSFYLESKVTRSLQKRSDKQMVGEKLDSLAGLVD